MNSKRIQFQGVLPILLLIVISAAAAVSVNSQVTPTSVPSVPAVPVPAKPAVIMPQAPLTPTDVENILSDAAQTSSAAAAKNANAKNDDLDAILNEAVQTATALKQIDQQMETVIAPKIRSWKRRNDTHNANPCKYPEGHPEVCAAYNREAGALNTERDGLKGEVTDNDRQRTTAKSRLGMLRARLRVNAILRFCPECQGKTDPEAAKYCWDHCFDGADPTIRSCLDIPDLDAFASCLIRRGR